jgi:CRP/FNR family transcriptional regulator, cyclic AMP receptor protein
LDLRRGLPDPIGHFQVKPSTLLVDNAIRVSSSGEGPWASGKIAKHRAVGGRMGLQEVLANIPILSVLNAEELHHLDASLIRREYAKDQTIFRRGERGGTLFIIRSGRVKVFIPKTPGKELVLANLGAGEILGELSFIDGKTRSATAEALESTELFCLLREDFLELLRNRFELVLKVMEVLSQRLRDTDALLSERKSRSISFWLIKKILDLSRLFSNSKKI